MSLAINESKKQAGSVQVLNPEKIRQGMKSNPVDISADLDDEAVKPEALPKFNFDI